MSNKRWSKRKPFIKFSKTEDIVTTLLRVRGIKNKEDFLDPPLSVVHDPHLLKNIDKAAEIIINAIKKGYLIGISCDPDSDGVFSTGIMFRYLNMFTDNLYITYAQRSMGHGIEYQMDKVREETDLMIILDSSTNSVAACKELKERGIEVVILDHHDYEKANDYAVIVNPKLDDYPNKGLSGAGVVYKTIQVLDESFGTGIVDDFLDLVACGMYADMMQVDVLENRNLIIRGMRNIKNTGLLAILEANNIDESNFNSQTIGFTISPLINGVARMDQLELAIQLLIIDDYHDCMELVKVMKKINEERKAKEIYLFDLYKKKIDLDNKVLIVTDTEASKNFNGLIANKISQEYSRPSMVLREYEGELMGSYRSFADFPMRTLLNRTPSLRKLIKYAAGHEFAGGVALKLQDLEEFTKALNEVLAEENFDDSVKYDIEIDAKDVSLSLIRQIEEFDYLTGTGFPTSKILVKGVMAEDEGKVLGKNKDTIKIPCDGMDVIKFKTKPTWGHDVEPMDRVDVVGQLVVNEWTGWNGTITTCQVIAEDYRFSQ